MHAQPTPRGTSATISHTVASVWSSKLASRSHGSVYIDNNEFGLVRSSTLCMHVVDATQRMHLSTAHTRTCARAHASTHAPARACVLGLQHCCAGGGWSAPAETSARTARAVSACSGTSAVSVSAERTPSLLQSREVTAELRAYHCRCRNPHCGCHRQSMLCPISTAPVVDLSPGRSSDPAVCVPS